MMDILQVLEALKDSTSTRPAIFAMSNPTKNGTCFFFFFVFLIDICYGSEKHGF